MLLTDFQDANWLQEMAALNLGPAVPLRAEILITATADQIWQELSKAGYLKQCHPFCAQTEIFQWPGLGAHDNITYYSGRHHDRHFVAWEDGIGYDIELGVRPKITSRVLWRIEPKDNSQCLFSISVIPLVRRNIPDDKKQQFLAAVFGTDLQHYLECVVKGVDHWITTGTSVQEDQFGRNPLFSAP